VLCFSGRYIYQRSSLASTMVQFVDAVALDVFLFDFPSNLWAYARCQSLVLHLYDGHTPFVQKLQPVSAVAQDAWRGLTAALQG